MGSNGYSTKLSATTTICAPRIFITSGPMTSILQYAYMTTPLGVSSKTPVGNAGTFLRKGNGWIRSPAELALAATAFASVDTLLIVAQM